MDEPQPISIRINQIERLEFSGIRHDDGSVTTLGKKMEGWPERIEMDGVVFELEESDDRGESACNQTMAWYVPEE